MILCFTIIIGKRNIGYIYDGLWNNTWDPVQSHQLQPPSADGVVCVYVCMHVQICIRFGYGCIKSTQKH